MQDATNAVALTQCNTNIAVGIIYIAQTE